MKLKATGLLKLRSQHVFPTFEQMKAQILRHRAVKGQTVKVTIKSNQRQHP